MNDRKIEKNRHVLWKIFDLSTLKALQRTKITLNVKIFRTFILIYCNENVSVFEIKLIL
jgi:hypothetical protein